MKPDWDKLGTEYEGSSVVIGDADCTEHADLCQKYGVQGYPTIKYFTADTADTGDSYSGGRTFDDLKNFVDESLAVTCDVNDTVNCDEREVKFINKMKGNADKIAKQIPRLSGMKEKKMKAELKQWVNKRLAILKQLEKGHDEL
jgi:thioredoxin-like negative regulator of GroEL